MPFADTLRALDAMKEDGVVAEYAIAGAMAIVFWTEPLVTWDLDVLVFVPGDQVTHASLDGIYRWASERGYAVQNEHVVLEGVPTQFHPSPGPLGDEAIESAATLEYDGVPTRVVLPEHLVALYVQTESRSAKPRERAAMLLEWPGLSRKWLDAILERHGLSL